MKTPEFNFALKVLSLVSGIVAIACICVGLSGRGWMVTQSRFQRQENEVGEGYFNVGLWSASICGMMSSRDQAETCLQVDIAEYYEMLRLGAGDSTYTHKFQTGMDEMLMFVRALIIGSLACAVLGFAALCVFLFYKANLPVSKVKIGIACAVIWDVTFVLLIIAVSAQGMQNSTVYAALQLALAIMPKDKYTMNAGIQMLVPWTLVVCAIGALGCALVKFIVAICLYKNRADKPADDQNMQFMKF